MEKKFKVKVDESYLYEFKDSDAKSLDLLKLSKSKFHLINNNKSFDIELEQSHFYQKQYVIKVNKHSYKIKISDQLDSLINKMGFSVGAAKKENNIKAPMPGMILSINVKEGQKVKEGETLMILEAMKMENTIGAPKDGTIKAINTKSGNTVEKGELMIEMA
ncbi:acetyl-CoA carboxylase biotin carboxyl carrier protein subunit [Lutibacter aestuarii]|uniref:Acetyl-CoA carboxylase biotin carboxyl carrier protein subunit n=1 Tax=Lutibacter aestuarii TaxID=861111 RepID=A0ABW2Z7L0_9FLAO|nr:acetyl-CoA carboxylase biotin carboxyl carrier protein subunit [uncultured Lutibacter sp.]